MKLKLGVGILFVVAASLIATCFAQVPTNPCVDCRCPYIQDDRNYTTQQIFDNTRGYRYMEVFMTCLDKGTGIYNTMALNIKPSDGRDSAPSDLMANYSDQQVMTEYNSPFAWMSGIRHWTHDKMRILLSNNVRNLDGLDTRWGADAAINPENFNTAEAAYVMSNVTCNRTWYFDAGKPVYILDDPKGTPFVMQSYSLIVDQNQTMADLPNLGSTLKLPAGWKFRTKTLDQDLTIDGIPEDGKDNQWKVIQDDLRNTYSACWKSGDQTACNFQP
jgi:hypothetical protein